MTVDLTCPYCSTSFSAEGEAPGTTADCPCCASVATVTIPEGSNPEIIIDWVEDPGPDNQGR